MLIFILPSSSLLLLGLVNCRSHLSVTPCSALPAYTLLGHAFCADGSTTTNLAWSRLHVSHCPVPLCLPPCSSSPRATHLPELLHPRNCDLNPILPCLTAHPWRGRLTNQSTPAFVLAISLHDSTITSRCKSTPFPSGPHPPHAPPHPSPTVPRRWSSHHDGLIPAPS
jgi:hypothetical protein